MYTETASSIRGVLFCFNLNAIKVEDIPHHFHCTNIHDDAKMLKHMLCSFEFALQHHRQYKMGKFESCCNRISSVILSSFQHIQRYKGWGKSQTDNFSYRRCFGSTRKNKIMKEIVIQQF